jgi:hypothetical protein
MRKSLTFLQRRSALSPRFEAVAQRPERSGPNACSNLAKPFEATRALVTLAGIEMIHRDLAHREKVFEIATKIFERTGDAR